MTATIEKVVLPPIPAKRYFTIGEVSELCGVKPHVLRYWEQLSEAEAADVLGCSVGTVKSTASRGLARLRELTAAWAVEDVQAGNGAGK